MSRGFKISELDYYFTVLLLVVMVCSSTIGVFSRYIFNNTLPWPEELSRYTFMWFAFIASAYLVKTRNHIVVDVLSTIVCKNKPTRKVLVSKLIGTILWLAFAVFMVVIGLTLVKRTFIMGEHSVGTGLPLWILYMVGPVSFTIMSIRLIKNIYEDYKELKSPGENNKIQSITNLGI